MIFPFIEQLDLRQFEANMEAKDNLFPQTLPRSESEKVQLDNTVSSEYKFSKFSEL